MSPYSPLHLETPRERQNMTLPLVSEPQWTLCAALVNRLSAPSKIEQQDPRAHNVPITDTTSGVSRLLADHRNST